MQNVCRFKSDFPHHEESVKDRFIEGFETPLSSKYSVMTAKTTIINTMGIRIGNVSYYE